MTNDAYRVFFTTLANANRLRIINSLRKKSLNVSEISLATGLNQSTVSHNLVRLKKYAFVSVRQRGKCRYYSLNKETIIPLMNIMDEHVRKNCLETSGRNGG